jgi:hypothetical protein
MTTYTAADIRIATRFAEILKNWLDPADFAAMRERNVELSPQGVCASHDYCDANMAMLEAFQDVMLREYSFDNDEDHRAMRRAWDAAHDRGLIMSL